jgi:hypothetical protein
VGSIPASRAKFDNATLCGGVFRLWKVIVRQALAELLSTRWFAVLRVPAGFERGFWQGLSSSIA